MSDLPTAMQCSNTMSIATSSASSMDPLCATGLLRLMPSLSPGYGTASGRLHIGASEEKRKEASPVLYFHVPLYR